MTDFYAKLDEQVRPPEDEKEFVKRRADA